jgi:hypothetical protein
MRRLGVVAGLVMALAGCAKPGFATAVRATGSISALPSQVAPDAGWADRPDEDAPRFRFVDGWGLVLGTPRALASLTRELRSIGGPNRTVEPCKRQIELGAVQYADVMVDAASLGPEWRAGQQLFEGLVEMRVIYDFYLYREVRQAVLKCSTRPDGSIVDAEAVWPTRAATPGA